MLRGGGVRGAVVVAAVARNRHHQSRGGAVAPSYSPPSKSVPVPFHVRTVALSLPTSASNDHNGSDVVFYELTINGIVANSSWVVRRRFGDFVAISSKIDYLITSFKIESLFPPRHWFSWLFSLTEDEQRERQEGLSNWLSAVISIANGDFRPPNSSTFDVNQVRECMNEFLDVTQNLSSAVQNAEVDGEYICRSFDVPLYEQKVQNLPPSSISLNGQKQYLASGKYEEEEEEVVPVAVFVSCSSNNNGPKEKLLELKSLLDAGLITQSDYDEKKAYILQEIVKS